MRMRRMSLRALVLVLSATVSLSSAVAVAGPPDLDAGDLPALPREKSVPGEPVPVRALPPNEVDAKAITALPAPQWPGRAVAETDLPPGRGEASPGAARRPGAGVEHRRAGELPVSVGRAPGGPASAPGQAGQGRVRVETFDQDTAAKAGVHGLLLRVEDRGGAAGAGISVRVDYSRFAGAFGGDFGSRLRLVELPACVLTTPEKSECRQGKPLPTDNDTARREVTGETTLPGRAGASGEAEQTEATAAGVTVLALTAAPSGSGGTYTATSLAPSGSWAAGGSSGEFTYTYPFRTPPSPGGAAPRLGLGYSSGSLDGRTSTTNNQASLVGDGWELSVGGFVERRYKSCADDANGNQGTSRTVDQCWVTDNATLMLDGVSTELVKDAATGVWRPKRDDGSRVERLTGGVNGDDDGEYWKVTTVDGTQYFFGLNRLPGWADGRPETRSTWTVPVFGNHAGEPCHKASFADSWCQQAWRWNLDYVVDPRGNVVTYYYETEVNHYGRNYTATNGTPYVRAGYVSRIEYGLRSDDVFAPAPARVRFEVAERCLPGDTITCDPGQLNASTASSWPDVPFDQICEAGQSCDNRYSPTFFTRKRLTKVVTEVLRDDVPGPEWRAVDSWSLRHQFPKAGEAMDPALWLAGITHTGHVGGTASVPEITFHGIPMENRVDSAVDNLPSIARYRVVRIVNEAGGLTEIGYSGPDCRKADRMPASPETNTMRCYPVWWSPEGATGPLLDWFHKYVVTAVTEDDRTGGSSLVKTSYEYLGDAAWHYDDNDLAKPEHRTWSQWRGYGKVRTIRGEAGQTRTVTESLYLRGMDGDRRSDGSTRDEWVEDSEGGRIEDHERLQGFVRETLQYDGDKVVSASLNDPWLHGPTATNGDDRAFVLDTASVRGRTLLEDGSWRRTQVTRTFNAQGIVEQVDDAGDVAVTGDEKCTRTTYARNEGAWMLNYASRVRTVALPCSAGEGTNDDVISDVRSAYDDQAPGLPPTRGDITTTERWDGTGYQVVTRTVYDPYGRAVEAYDAANAKTTTSYSPAAGYLVRTVATTNPLGHVSTNTLEPARAAPVTEVGPNGERTDIEYDPLGRLTKVWIPGRSKAAGQSPNTEYIYEYRSDAPTVVTTKSLREDGQYNVSYALYDGLLRQRQTQAPAVGGGRMITDTWYDHRGLPYKTNAAYYNADPPSTTLHGVLDNHVPNQTRTVFDGLERPTKTAYHKFGQEQWSTTTSYGGDRTHVTPPAGDTPMTVIKDAQGRIVERRQYHGPTTSGSYDTTVYRYTRKGQLESVTDPAGNTWRYEYDLLGRKAKDVDPDKGETTYTYDHLDQLVSSTDARDRTLAYTYDVLGRRTAMFEGSTTGTKLAEWTYDTLKKGLPTASIRYVDGQAYIRRTDSYDEANRVTSSSVVIPDREGRLAGTYTFRTGYTPNTGLVEYTDLPGVGGLPEEAVFFEYNELGLPTRSFGEDTYVSDTRYSEFGELLRIQAGAEPNVVYTSLFYEDGTRRLSRILTQRTTSDQAVVSDRTFTYDPAGNITSVVETPINAPTDPQCFRYDHLRRLTEAWTPGNGDCAAAPSIAGLGGPAPYWYTFGYDRSGNRTSEVRHTAQGDITRTYTYPAPGSPQPHTLRSVSQNGPQGTSLDEFTYDATGNTLTRKIAGSTQSLEWDAEGNLAKVTNADGRSSTYVYDAGGERLLRKDPGAVTLYLPGTEVYLDTSTGVVTGKRYYSHGGTTVAVRTSTGGLTFLTADHQGTTTTTVRASDLRVSRRYFDPFGNSRGPEPASWPDDKGFVGGTKDVTGLTHLGAREYDPATGRFISVDPIMDLTDPQQMHGYAYANNSPVTFSDPTGLLMGSACGPDGIMCGYRSDLHSSYDQYVKTRTIWHRKLHGKAVASRFWKNNGPGSWVYKARQASVRNAVAEQAALEAALAEAGVSKAEYERAKALASQTLMDVVIEAGGDILMEVLGVNDIKSCFTQGDWGACAQLIMDVIPWSRIISRGDDIVRAGVRAFEAVQTWVRESAAARALIGKVNAVKERLKRTGGGGEGASCPIGNSFVPGTLILLADGTSKPIEQVAIGDQVLATDPVTGESGPRAVVATIVGEGRKHLVEVVVDTDGAAGKATGTVVATDGHPFWLPELREWVPASAVRAGDLLQTSAGTWVQVVSVRAWTASHRVHNLTVDGLHTYHVLAGHTPVLVHNCGPDIDVNDLKLSDTVARHTGDITKKGTPARPFNESRLTMQEIMKGSTPRPDPGGVPGGLRWDTPGALNGKEGVWELVVDTRTNTVLHYNFVTR